MANQFETSTVPWEKAGNMNVYPYKNTVPWKLRSWMFRTDNGHIVLLDADCKFDEESKQWVVRTVQEITNGSPVLNHQVVEEIYAHAKKYFVSLSKALLVRIPNRKLTPEFVDAVKEAPEVYVFGATPADKSPMEPQKV